MKIEIDLELLKNKELNINEYLTLLKIKLQNESSNIPYNTGLNIINSLIEKKLVNLDMTSDIISLTEEGYNILGSSLDDISEVLNYFKEVTGKKILQTSPSNRKFVKDRLSEGYTKEDLKAVIDIKNKEWAGTSMDMYIRIQTLFNDTKFQKYISEITTSTRKENISVNVRRI
jgi:uncharacterized phage protein (TIGR02220 family)